MLSESQRRLFLVSLGSTAGFEEACLQAGISPGAAVAERVRNPRFAREWDRHLDACIARLETLLVERATSALASDFPGSDARAKWLVGLVQWLLEPRRTTAPRSRPAVAGGADLPPPREAPRAEKAEQDSPSDAAEVARLIDKAAARLAEAEAQMARDGLFPGEGG